jgi:4'-phosphopantetheinyl transferase
MVEPPTVGNEETACWPINELNLSRFMAHNNIRWPLPADHCALAANDVHLWAAHLDLRLKALAHMAAILSEEEQERAGHFRFERHHNRFIAARGFLRSLLAIYLECAPDELQFEYDQNGKPALTGTFAASGLAFNLAHSQDLALIAVTRLGPIGVDVEQIRPMADADELVERFFSPRENALFRTLPDDQKNAAFFKLWTRKEAWLKATGEGISH